MKQVILTRVSDDGKQTLGTLSFKQDNGSLFLCKTLELPYLGNKQNVSCVPSGTYQCVYTRSESFSAKAGHDVFTYELTKVNKRSGIRIHSANYSAQLQGCIALGSSYGDINHDGITDVLDSRNTIAAFEHQLNYEPFTLVIHPVVKQ